jgi:hypothetical protein
MGEVMLFQLALSEVELTFDVDNPCGCGYWLTFWVAVGGVDVPPGLDGGTWLFTVTLGAAGGVVWV